MEANGLESEQLLVVKRVTDASILPELEPHFVFQDEEERGVYSVQLMQFMQLGLTRVCVVVAFEGTEVIGFVIAENTLAPHAWLSQIWCSPQHGLDVANQMREVLLLWASALGKTHLRAVTNRDMDALHRRFGFYEISKNVEYKIDSNLFQETLRLARSK